MVKRLPEYESWVEEVRWHHLIREGVREQSLWDYIDTEAQETTEKVLEYLTRTKFYLLNKGIELIIKDI